MNYRTEIDGLRALEVINVVLVIHNEFSDIDMDNKIVIDTTGIFS